MANMTDYETTRAEFRVQIPDRFNYTSDVIGARAAETPDKVALIAIEPDGVTVNRYTFDDLANLAHRTAHVLRAQGIGKGDRVFVQLPRIVEWYAVMLGCFQIGAIPMPGTTQLMSKDQAYRINRAGAIAAICDKSGAIRLAEVLDQCPSLIARFVVGFDLTGWTTFGTALDAAPGEPAYVEPTDPDDPLLLYFTSGTTAHPKMV
jgi:acyl-coenzyme A synthetase/AMP-(fatty) acid ligase